MGKATTITLRYDLEGTDHHVDIAIFIVFKLVFHQRRPSWVIFANYWSSDLNGYKMHSDSKSLASALQTFHSDGSRPQAAGTFSDTRP